MMVKQPLILIDAGHGSTIAGTYSTGPNKRVERHESQINEGVLNRAIASLLAFRLDFRKIPVQLVTPENKDISLSTRTKRVNELCKSYNCFLLSIHHNYYPDPAVSGTELFTYYGDSPADPIAEEMALEFQIQFPHGKIRKSSPRRLTKEAGYWILKNSKCPAVLTEFGFMSNTHEYNEMSSLHGISAQVNWLEQSMIDVYDELKYQYEINQTIKG